jgi:hypothetical protein
LKRRQFIGAILGGLAGLPLLKCLTKRQQWYAPAGFNRGRLIRPQVQVFKEFHSLKEFEAEYGKPSPNNKLAQVLRKSAHEFPTVTKKESVP